MTVQCRTEHGLSTSSPWLVEGLRLFFPVAACHALLSPLIWVAVFVFALPFARDIPASQWHAHEMIFGTYGAALAGFLTSAVPEWTDTPPRRGRALLILLALFLPGRMIGMVGLDTLVGVAALTDLAFLGLLFWYVLKALVDRGSTRHASFAVWVGLFWLIELAVRVAWMAGMTDVAARLLHAALMVFVVFFSLAVARINVAIINLALDPSGETTPYRPHPGRQNLTAGLVALYAGAALAAPDSTVPAYLALAAAAAFFDRLAEWFIGVAVFRTHVLALAAANLFAGAGFLFIGLAGLGAPFAMATGFHVLSVASLGLAVLSVFIIAGLRHTGRTLDLPWQAHAAVVVMIAAGLVRVLPEIGIASFLLGGHYTFSGSLWSLAFAIWLAGFLPLLRHPLDEANVAPADSGDTDRCVAIAPRNDAERTPLNAPAAAPAPPVRQQC
ncbi:NnrS family protein [Bradyrhizobium sp.]|uniref:NnrS family protein n=1 Tax=Bradyrhizobium sp. TaxID=376 RepID=UPI002C0BC2BD|nr:NnrS family protein [Bradyrhizobium sp.]HMM89977.1 NnrS family protein [Bradyrhizobium sp.]